MEYGTHMTIVHGASCGVIYSLSQPVQQFILHTNPWISNPVFEFSHTQLIQSLKNKHFTYRDQHRLWPVLPDLGHCTGLSTPNAMPSSLFYFFPLDCIRSPVLSCFYLVSESIGISSWGEGLTWSGQSWQVPILRSSRQSLWIQSPDYVWLQWLFCNHFSCHPLAAVPPSQKLIRVEFSHLI